MSAPETCSTETKIPGIFTFYVRVVHWLAIVGGVLATLCLVILTFLVFTEVLLAAWTKFFPAMHADIPVAWEYSGYLMGAAFMLGSSLTMRAGGHVRVTALIGTLTPKARHIVECFTTTIGMLFSAFLSYALIAAAFKSFQDGNVSFASYTPLWIPQTAIAVGALFLTLALIERLIRCLFGLELEIHGLKVVSSHDLDITKD
ncbi:TRAP-type mannitol/chloroaromatic compound transport system, small permease component [Cohaesibacter marisflavi]|uniref:TRAP transporter small permease protein n=1 Tax=Cohaesibacter marisflavi TaxID=655353 RepID=A0A1I5M2V2_9HYPH|nr:TRAP transporter small permease [Cohaesibacter marisflavi]SFP03855.1 TRAP-type mannitol/chloroaromatic compound transport system, small permease component [Cohaesibacter marisflavi]